MQNTDQTCKFEDVARLDNSMTLFLVESTHKLLSHIPKIKRHLDLIILKKFSLWQGPVNNTQQPNYWNIRLGDAHYYAYSIKTPVLTDFIRQDILDNRPGKIHTSPGDLIIAKKTGDIACFVNIGLTADITIIDTSFSKILLHSDTGPGTCLIDLAAREAGCDHGIDRDGTTALAGTVNTEALKLLLTNEWFGRPAPKHIDSILFKDLYNHQCLRSLSSVDKLSTVTAFTALTISDLYKREYSYAKKPTVIWLSGGGTNNLALIEFLKAYFSPVAVKNVEELGIPNNSRFPLTLGLTVQEYLNKNHLTFQESNMPPVKQFGRWIFP